MTIRMKANSTTSYSPNTSVDRKQQFSAARNLYSILSYLTRVTIYSGRYIQLLLEFTAHRNNVWFYLIIGNTFSIKWSLESMFYGRRKIYNKLPAGIHQRLRYQTPGEHRTVSICSGN